MQDKAFDLSYLNSQIGDSAIVDEIVNRYMIHAGGQIQRLSSLDPVPGNREEIHRIAHSIKSGAGNIGADALRTTARNLELKTKTGAIEGCTAEIKKLIQDFHSLQESITVKIPGEKR